MPSSNKIGIYPPDKEIIEKLNYWAKKERRSLSSHCLLLLERALEAKEKEDPEFFQNM
ncbi:hypothetical protein [Nostoc sp. DedQUE09]|uniref:hypothetical protein n=1 Tax=Nostoc sp. DedQUE09 TaxID=3075394 RepID=UPI002AD48CE0|nr:hypothetical protein [Nostoc sp. DedQUE09]MDZ7955893.1 hypothetical protein [Nostoc sp. DedQUE09]